MAMANATAVAQDVQDVYFMEFLILGSISFASAFGLCCYQIYENYAARPSPRHPKGTLAVSQLPPGRFIKYRAFCQMVYAGGFIYAGAMKADANHSAALTAIYRSGETGINIWLLFVLLDLVFIVRNPFNPDRHVSKYHLCSWLIAIATGLWDGYNTQEKSADGADWNQKSSLFIDLVIIVIVIVSAFVLHHRLGYGSRISQKARSCASSQQITYTIGFTVSDIGAVAIHSFVWANHDQGSWGGASDTEIYVMAGFLACRGTWDLVVWLTAQFVARHYREVTREGVLGKDEYGELDIRNQLRYELVLFTAKGIHSTVNKNLVGGNHPHGHGRHLVEASRGRSTSHPAVLHHSGVELDAESIAETNEVQGSPIKHHLTRDHEEGTHQNFLTPQDRLSSGITSMLSSDEPSQGTHPNALTKKDSQFQIDTSPDKLRKSSTGGVHPEMEYDGRKVDFFGYKDEEFKAVREACGLNEVEYANSFSMVEDLIDEEGGTEKFSEIVSSGASGSYFYFSPDHKYIVKTISRDEKQTLVEVCDSLRDHCVDNPGTMIHYYGLHSIRLPLNTAKVYFVVMRNFLIEKCDVTADLKGATANRRRFARGGVELEFTAAQKALYEQKAVKGTLLDLDWRDLRLRKNRVLSINVGPDRRKRIAHVLAADLAWLAERELIDYSILLGIRFPKIPTDDLSPSREQAEDEAAERAAIAEEELASTAAALPTMGDGMALATDTKYGDLTLQQRLERERAQTIGRRAFKVTLDEPRLSFETEGSGASLPLHGTGAGGGVEGNFVVNPDAAVTANEIEMGSDEDMEEQDPSVMVHVGRDGTKYFIGMIDILEKWSPAWEQQGCVLYCFLKYVCCSMWYNPRGATAIEPVHYSLRFEEFFLDQIIRSEALLDQAPPPGDPKRHFGPQRWRPWW